ncbi:MAG TPA: low molecular weight protein arginine phosphatase [Opitutaceae bacterium]|nr:low molecular weight protein arginine phosphatase [Opitutaceae bacterium]
MPFYKPMPDPGHILVVCTGNICRSPMATALLEHALAARPEPLRSLRVVSAGVASRTGEPASPNAIAALKKVGVDLTGHVSRPVTQELLDRSLLVLCMTEAQREMIELTADPVPRRLFLFREFTGEPGGREIPDPYGMHLSAYEACRDEMVAAIPSIIGYLSKLPPDVLAGR